MPQPSNLGYIVLSVSDLPAWEHFTTQLIGLMPGRKTENSLALRLDDHALRLLLKRSAEDDIAAAGWQFDTISELDYYVQHLRNHDVEVVQGSDEEAKERCVERFFACVDPNGVRHEFFFGPTHASISTPFRSPVLKGNFVTGRQGIGHVLPVSRDYKKAVDFYTDVLGFRISDYIRDPNVIPGGLLDATFFHTHTGRHHSLATLQAPSQKKLNHFMLEVSDLNDVGLARDRCRKAGLRFFMDIGHHPNDKVISFYVQTPSGFAMELGHGSILIDDDAWEIKNYSEIHDWGHEGSGPDV